MAAVLAPPAGLPGHDELVAIARRAIATYEGAMAGHLPSPGRPCRRGCSSCCFLPVDATWAEVALVAEAAERVLGVDASRHRARDAIDSGAGLTGTDRIRARVGCPMLEADGSCAVYASRPLYCRAFNAIASREACDRLVGSATGRPDPRATVVMDPVPFEAAASAQAGIDREIGTWSASIGHVDLAVGLAATWGA